MSSRREVAWGTRYSVTLACIIVLLLVLIVLSSVTVYYARETYDLQRLMVPQERSSRLIEPLLQKRMARLANPII